MAKFTILTDAALERLCAYGLGETERVEFVIGEEVAVEGLPLEGRKRLILQWVAEFNTNGMKLE